MYLATDSDDQSLDIYFLVQVMNINQMNQMVCQVCSHKTCVILFVAED